MENIDAFIKEINQLKEADDIVRTIFIEVGPYNLDIFSAELAEKIRAYNHFDDSP